MVTKIEVLGTGCAKCRRLEKNVREAVENLGTNIEVVKIEDLHEITDRGVMMTPGLIIDGEIVALGRVPGVDEIKEMLSER
jgi:small redox-active disulfide protein 2